MQFSCATNLLLAGLSVAARALSARTTQPIYEGILIRANSHTGCVTLTGSDGLISIVTTVAADIEEDGCVILPGKLFYEVMRRMPVGTLSVKLNDKLAATLRCMISRTTIAGQDAALYPALPQITEYEQFTLPQTLLRDMIQRTAFAISTDETRPVLMGSLMELSHGEIRMVAIDGFRLALRLSRVASADRQINAIVPSRTLSEIAKLMSDNEEDMVQIDIFGNQMRITVDDTHIYATLIEGEFIRYRQIIPQEFSTQARVDTRLFAGCIERASLMAREGKNNLVRFAVRDGVIVITSNSESGDVYEEIDAKITGEGIDIAFNVRYMQEVLRAIDDEEMVLNFNTPVSPCLIKPTGGDAFVYLILPVRVNA